MVVHFTIQLIFCLVILSGWEHFKLRYWFISSLTVLHIIKEAPILEKYGLFALKQHFLYFLLSLLYFFHHHLVPLYSPPSINHHTVVHVPESIFLFAQSLPSTSLPSLSAILLCLYVQQMYLKPEENVLQSKPNISNVFLI